MTLTTIMHWFPWLAGTSLVVLGALAIFLPSALTVISAWLVALTPLVKGAAEATVEFVKRLWDGLLDVVDNVSTILFVVVVCVVAYAWGNAHTSKHTTRCPTPKFATKATPCDKIIADLRKQYRFVPRKPESKKVEAPFAFSDWKFW